MDPSSRASAPLAPSENVLPSFGPLDPQSHDDHTPSAPQDCPPRHAPGPTHIRVSPAEQAETLASGATSAFEFPPHALAPIAAAAAERTKLPRRYLRILVMFAVDVPQPGSFRGVADMLH